MKKILLGFLPLFALGLATAWPQEEEEEKETPPAPVAAVTNAPVEKKKKAPKIGRAHV